MRFLRRKLGIGEGEIVDCGEKLKARWERNPIKRDGGSKMRDWVKPYLLEDFEKINKELGFDHDQNEWSMDHVKEELEDEEAVCYRLADQLRIHFSTFGIGDEGWLFKAAFGSVLSDLPKEVFLQLVRMKHVFFTFTPNSGAEVKHFVIEEGENIGGWDRIVIVTFPYALISMSLTALRGSIVHELVHVCLHSDKGASDDAMEAETDRVSEEWGFKKEIRTLRE